jgi:magnesium-transporting ATPase (P-type)
VCLKKTELVLAGDHPKTAEAIARKINLILGDTRESLAAKTGRSPEEVYDDEFSAVVIHGDDIDGLQGWQWDQSAFHPIWVLRSLMCISFRQGRNCVCSNFPQA